MARGFKFRIYEAEILNYLYSEIKGAYDRAADLRLCFRTCKKPTGFLMMLLNRAYPENTKFETFVPRNLKFHTFGDLHTTKKC